MQATEKTGTILKRSLLAGLAILASSYSSAGDVKFYDKAPSVEELQNQLSRGDNLSSQKKPKTRSIQFNDIDSAQETNLPSQQLDSPKVLKPLTAKTPAIQLDENAIAFPLNFRANSTEILSESIPFLETIAGLLKKEPALRLIVEGHTDISGNPERNNSLSRERAYSVVNFLIDRYHIEPSRLLPVGKGFSEPMDGLSAANPKNRRVQFRPMG